MKQIAKKISLFVLVSALLIGLCSKVSFKAESVDYKEASEAVTTNVFGTMTANSQKIETINNGVQDTSSNKYYWNNHTVHWVDFDPSNDVKVVTYSGSNQDKWKQMTTRQAAADWEKNNPGWIVVAGINGDFFNNSGSQTYEPTGNFMQGGDMYRAQKAGVDYRQTIGWNADGSVIVGDPSVSSSMYLRVYNEDKSAIENDIVISAVNKTPSDAGITLLTKDVKSTFDLTGYKVIDCTYDICRISTGGYVFVKGTVGEVVTLGANSAPSDDHFYLVAKDGSLDNVVVAGDYVKCEYVYENDWSNVQNSIGYIYQVLDNGTPQLRESTEAFCNTTHPRTLIGFKEDGSTVFMVVEGRGLPQDYQVGVSLYEAGQLLQAQGCVSGFNLDGGGSSTLIVRNQYNGFNVLNEPSDGSERSDGNHCLVVMRDPGFIYTSIDSEYDKAVIELIPTKPELFNTLSNIKVTVNGVTKDYVDSPISFDNVEMLKEYPVTITYDSPGTYDYNVTSNKTYITSVAIPEYNYPDHGLFVKDVTDTSITIAKNMKPASASQIQDVIVHVGNKTFNLGNNEVIECKDLYQGVEYEVYYEYVVVAPNGTRFNLESEVFTVKTKAFKLPTIVSFTENNKGKTTLKVDYEFSDTDGVVTKAYIELNGEAVKDVTLVNKGNAYLTKLDYEENDYIVKLVIEYLDENGKNIKVESEPLEYIREAAHEHNFVEGKCECGEIDPTYVPPHVHEFVEGKCECGEIDPNYVPPHVHNFVEGKCECGETDPNYVPPHVHNFVEGKCECGETDPNYVPPHTHNFVEGKCECGETDPTYVPPHVHNFKEGKCECGETDPNYEAPKKKCGKKSAELLIATLAAASVIGVFFRKRK